MVALAGCAAPADPGPTRYLIFQHFTAAPIPDPGDPNGAHVLIQPNASYDQALADDEAYADRVTSLVGVTPARGRVLGFAMGPLGLDLGDQILVDSIRAGFDAAQAKHVAVAFHLDISHFWKRVADADGRLSDGTGALDVHEWMDFAGTIAAAGQHPGSDDWQPNLLPAMCYACDRVEAMVDHVTSVIGPELAAGAASDLFAGVIIGWEAGSDNPLGYHSLSVKGYDAATPNATLRLAQQQILHDYIERWARNLNGYGIATTKIYTHLTSCTQWDIDNHFCNPSYANGPDAFWEMFNAYSIGGVSVYANVAAEGTAEAAADAAATYGGGAWGMMEGTNVNIFTGDQSTNSYGASDVDFETYLAKIYNHGGVMADIFGFEGTGVTASSTDEAVAAYRKFLTGGTLVEH